MAEQPDASDWWASTPAGRRRGVRWPARGLAGWQVGWLVGLEVQAEGAGEIVVQNATFAPRFSGIFGICCILQPGAALDGRVSWSRMLSDTEASQVTMKRILAGTDDREPAF
ncbi:hypothetical protein [Paenibacillus sp. GCM10027626]|uniref:hypothetical protein n=1 Tax=Paenibacillus sp. GCM10027626 TaxID=3273411 RepID=UPI0036364BDB